VYDSLPALPYHHKALYVYNLLLEILSSSSDSSSAALAGVSFPTEPIILEEQHNKGPYPTLVLDLDETLLHVTSGEKKKAPDFVIWDEEHRVASKVFKRPHVEQFLSILSHYYEIILFTSSYQCYCDPLVDLLPSSEVIFKRFYNTSLTTVTVPSRDRDKSGGGGSSSGSDSSSSRFEKDLYLAAPYNMPKRLLLMDNRAEACLSHPENLYLVPSYLGQEMDYALISSLLVLISMTDMKDFRDLLGKRQREGWR
jgi:CTD nuclear envelope phosphatase 1